MLISNVNISPRSILNNAARTTKSSISGRSLLQNLNRKQRSPGLLSRMRRYPTTIGNNFQRTMRKAVLPLAAPSRRIASKGMSFGKRAIFNRTTGYGAGAIGAVAGIGFGIGYGVAAMARASKRPPVVQTSAIRSTGQTNQYFNMGADPFAGVRFATKR